MTKLSEEELSKLIKYAHSECEVCCTDNLEIRVKHDGYLSTIAKIPKDENDEYELQIKFVFAHNEKLGTSDWTLAKQQGLAILMEKILDYAIATKQWSYVETAKRISELQVVPVL